ncbi:flagellar assembly protein FliH [Halobacillus sp. A5]|uniref:flagellar assembly protein FliH n=1 Tax=Halobacillus sp. A5 TaxID=2880263 RepID=UPI0020A67703|nr:flagellar assembly protein FliH [Halobacillus sp. A5]MCP3026123.1 flagellar assembly protein FliH [Halobacillus sp. A5]
MYNNRRVIEIKPVADEKRHPSVDVQQQAGQLLAESKTQLLKAERQAEDMLQEARQLIEQEKKEWRKEKDYVKRQAEEKGYQEGFLRGEQKGVQSYSEKIDEINYLAELARQDYLTEISSTEEAIIEIAVACSEKIINKELEQNKDCIAEIVKKAIEEVYNQPEIKIYVHPDDYKIIHSQKEELASIIDYHSSLHIIMKETVERNGCIIESPFGQINAEVSSQLQELRERLHQLALEEKNDE